MAKTAAIVFYVAGLAFAEALRDLGLAAHLRVHAVAPAVRLLAAFVDHLGCRRHLHAEPADPGRAA